MADNINSVSEIDSETVREKERERQREREREREMKLCIECNNVIYNWVIEHIGFPSYLRILRSRKRCSPYIRDIIS